MRSTPAFAWLILALLAGCKEPPPPAAEIRPARTVTATPQSEGELVSVTGHIRARIEENLAFRVDGRMIARRMDVGQVVQTNDLVAELDPLQRDGRRDQQRRGVLQRTRLWRQARTGA